MDGMGEGCFDEFTTLTTYGFETYIPSKKIKVVQESGVPVAASGRPTAAALKKRWKAVMSKSMAKGGKKELKKLLTAIDNRDEKAVRNLMGSVDLNKGMRFSEVQFDGRPPLYLAVWKSAPNIVELLLDAGADPNCSGERDAAIHRCEDLEVLKLLLEAGADPNLQCDARLSPLTQYHVMRQPKMVKLLLKHGADPNLEGQITPLQFCAEKQPKLASAKLLIEAGAKVEEEAFIGAATFRPARHLRQDESDEREARKVAELLFGKFKVSPASCQALEHTAPKLSRMIIDAVDDVNHPLLHNSVATFYPLQYAAGNDAPIPIMKVLLEKGADPKLCPQLLKNALKMEEHSIVKLLLKYGVVPSEDHVAMVEDEFPRIAKLLRAAM